MENSLMSQHFVNMIRLIETRKRVKREENIDLRRIGKLEISYMGELEIEGTNTALQISFSSCKGDIIDFSLTINNTKSRELVINPDTYSDHEIEILVRKIDEPMKQTIDFIEHEKKEWSPPESKEIDMRRIDRLVFEHDGEIMIEGCNTVMFVNFRNRDFVSVILEITTLNRTLFGNDDIIEESMATVRVLFPEKTI